MTLGEKTTEQSMRLQRHAAVSAWAIRFFWCIVGASLVAGIFFRTDHIRHRLFWEDESFAALYVSGYRGADFSRMFDGRIHTIAQINKFQQVLDPSRTAIDTIKSIAAEDPRHAPLFYILDHFWAKFGGSSIPALRSLAFVFSLTAILATYWLCIELGGGPLAAAAAASIMAVSPIFVNYGAQTREYSLWATLIGVTSSQLLRVSRSPSKEGWIIYAAAMVVSLYAEVLMVCVLASHAVFIVMRRPADRKNIVAFAFSGVAALVLFLPWLVTCARILVGTEKLWARNYYPFHLILEKWVFNLGAILFDAEYANLLLTPVAGAMLLLLIYSVVRLLRDESANVIWFLSTLAVGVALPQFLIDIATHGHASAIPRYEFPLWVALAAGLGLFFGRRIADDKKHAGLAWSLVFGATLTIAALSSAISSAAISWWDNDDEYPSSTMAAYINESGPSPLIVAERLRLELGVDWQLLVMSHYLAPATRLLLFTGEPPPLPLSRSSNTFLLMPSRATLAAFETNPNVELTPVWTYSLASSMLQGYRRSLREAQGRRSSRDVAFLYRVYRRRGNPTGRLP